MHVRLASETDYQAVLEMSHGHFNGHDSLPHRFHSCLERMGKDHFIFVATVKGKVIGLSVVQIVDSGSTFITNHLRVHPQFRGRGYGTQLIQIIRKQLRTNYPSLVRERYVSGVKNLQRLAIAKKMGDRLLRRIDSCVYLVNPTILDMSKLDHPILSRIRPYTNEEFKIVTSSSKEKLFKQGIMVLCTVAYEATPANVDIVADINSCYVFGGPTDPRLGCVESFSHGVKILMTKLQTYRVSVFADDPELFLSHIIHQLLSACRIMDGQFFFRVDHDEDRVLKSRALAFLESTLGLVRETERYYTPNDEYKALVFESEDLPS